MTNPGYTFAVGIRLLMAAVQSTQAEQPTRFLGAKFFTLSGPQTYIRSLTLMTVGPLA